MLELSSTLSLPVDAATQTFAFIARKGAGKTYAAGKLAELLIAAGVQVVVLDTVGNWYGLRLNKDGKTPGFDIPVLGGLRGDLPLESAAAGLIADLVVDTGRSMVLDLSQFSLADRKRFATGFGERLWQRKKGEEHPVPLHLVIEESQLIVPQFSGRGGDDARMLGIFEEIIRLGRNYGIGVSMISQRPQSVNKEVLNQTECLLCGQVNGFQERAALKNWIVHQGMDVHLIDELPSLPVGTFYVWSPQWLQILQKIKIAPKTTLDASATPKVGQSQTRRQLQPLDLDDLKQKLAATIERHKADDPRELRRQIADLKRQVGAKNVSPVPEPVEIKVPVITPTDFETLELYVNAVRSSAESVLAASKRIADQLTDIRSAVSQFKPIVPLNRIGVSDRGPIVSRKPLLVSTEPAKFDPTLPPAPGQKSRDISNAAERVLSAIATLRDRRLQVNKAAVARWLGIHPNGRRFNGTLADLRKDGWLDDFEFTENTPHVRSLLCESGVDGVVEVLKEGSQKNVFRQIVVSANGHAISKEELMQQLGIHPNGRRFNGTLAWLRDMGVIPERGPIAPTEGVFR